MNPTLYDLLRTVMRPGTVEDWMNSTEEDLDWVSFDDSELRGYLVKAEEARAITATALEMIYDKDAEPVTNKDDAELLLYFGGWISKFNPPSQWPEC